MGYGRVFVFAVFHVQKKGVQMEESKEIEHNSKKRDSSGKMIFEDPILCAQFVRGYTDMPIFQNVQPEDIENVSNRYIHMFMEERQSDVVNKIYLKDISSEEKEPFYLLTLIEHKSSIDYNVVMQILRYMVYIWEDYEKQMEMMHKGISTTKDFKYPPVLPIVYYEGMENWEGEIELKDRILLSDVFEEFLPQMKCKRVQLKDYSDEELMKKKDELSVVFMISKVWQMDDFVRLGENVPKEHLERTFKETPEYLLKVIAKITAALLTKINVPEKEIETFTEQIKERKMGMLFENFQAYDVQETRRIEHEKAVKEVTETLTAEITERVTEEVTERVTEEVTERVTEEVTERVTTEVTQESISKLVQVIKELGNTKEDAIQKLMEKYALVRESAKEQVDLYW